jgi:GT2 family glycosyltransferase
MEAAIVIANWNGKEHLKVCFDSLANQSVQNYRIIFVDNGSSDGSADFIRDNYLETRFPSRLEIIQFAENTGFSHGYNAGIRKALADENIKYVVILNNDIKLNENFIEEMVRCAQKHPDAGSIQPKVLNYFEKNKIDCTGIVLSVDGVAMNRGYGERDGSRFEKEEEIFGANGTASLFSAAALRKTELNSGEYFDNEYFAYHEDMDLAWRLRLAGYRSYFCQKARLYHVHSATADKISGFKAYYLNRNRFLTIIKNYPLCKVFLAIFLLTPVRYGYLLWLAIRKKGRKGQSIAGQKKSLVAGVVLRAWASVFANLPGAIKKRRLIQAKKTVKKEEIDRWFRDFGIKFSKTF